MRERSVELAYSTESRMEQPDRFADELHQWTLNGKEPEDASRDLRFFLDLQEKRLKEAGVEREEEFTHVREEISGCLPRFQNGFTSRICYREAMQEVTYRKNGKPVRRIRRPVILYVTVIDRDHDENREFTCPMCGHTMKASEAEKGCPFCGTFFETEDNYPCVTSYYTVSTVTERAGLMDRMKKELLAAGLVCGILTALLSFFAWQEMILPFRIIASILMGVLYGGVGAFVWYMFRSLLLFGKVMLEAGRSVSMLKTLGSRKKMTEFMKEYDPAFSYEAFEGRIISLLRTVIFTRDRDTLSIWESDRDLSCFDGIADMQYRGGLQIRKLRETDGILQVEGTAYLCNTYVRRSVREKNEKIRFIAEREVSGSEDLSFSIHRVSCTSCGGSFDAMHRKTCPYCGTPYHLKKKDWILKDMP